MLKNKKILNAVNWSITFALVIGLSVTMMSLCIAALIAPLGFMADSAFTPFIGVYVVLTALCGFAVGLDLTGRLLYWLGLIVSKSRFEVVKQWGFFVFGKDLHCQDAPNDRDLMDMWQSQCLLDAFFGGRPTEMLRGVLKI